METTDEAEDELPAEIENDEPVEDILDNLTVQGLEVTYPEQPEDKEVVLVATQEDGPSQNTRSRNILLATVECQAAAQPPARQQRDSIH